MKINKVWIVQVRVSSKERWYPTAMHWYDRKKDARMAAAQFSMSNPDLQYRVKKYTETE